MKTSNEKTESKPEKGMCKISVPGVLPHGAIKVEFPASEFVYCYTTGPFLLPQNSGSLDWIILNNESSQQTVRITIYQSGVGEIKTAAVPGPLTLTLQPGECTHNANTYTEGYIYEVQVECNSKMIFPYVSVWPGNFGVIIPGTGISSGSFILTMP